MHRPLNYRLLAEPIATGGCDREPRQRDRDSAGFFRPCRVQRGSCDGECGTCLILCDHCSMVICVPASTRARMVRAVRARYSVLRYRRASVVPTLRWERPPTSCWRPEIERQFRKGTGAGDGCGPQTQKAPACSDHVLPHEFLDRELGVGWEDAFREIRCEVRRSRVDSCTANSYAPKSSFQW